GESWVNLTNGIPNDTPVRVVREDPDRAGLLYAGTEFGLFLSFDNGAHWQSFQLNMPVTPVTDLKVHHQDLVLSTMGRGFWILDNLTLLHQLRPALTTSLFRSRPAYRMSYTVAGRRTTGPEYPPVGAALDYYLAADAADVKLEIVDSK